jgi:hypothetical protein
MKNLLKISVILLVLSMLFTRCELIKHGKEAFLGNYSTDIDYPNSVVELAIDMDITDNDLATNPPSVFVPLDSANKESFINAYFSEGSASIFDIGNDSVKYSDNKRTLYGFVKGDSVTYKTSDLGVSPPVNGVVIDSTILNTHAKSISNDVHMTYVFSGTGSVLFPPATIKRGIVRGTVKVIARK